MIFLELRRSELDDGESVVEAESALDVELRYVSLTVCRAASLAGGCWNSMAARAVYVLSRRRTTMPMSSRMPPVPVILPRWGVVAPTTPMRSPPTVMTALPVSLPAGREESWPSGTTRGLRSSSAGEYEVAGQVREHRARVASSISSLGDDGRGEDPGAAIELVVA